MNGVSCSNGLVRLDYQPSVSSTFLSEQINTSRAGSSQANEKKQIILLIVYTPHLKQRKYKHLEGKKVMRGKEDAIFRRENTTRAFGNVKSKVVFPQLGGAPLFIVRWWLPQDSYCSTCEWDGQPTINILVC
jgi:hypothetical protein